MNEKKVIKQLNEGSFYWTHDGSEGGHPGMIYWKNDKRNLYLAITTGTSEEDNPNFERLTEPTSSDVEKSFVNKNPFLGNRRDFDGENLDQKMSFHVGDYDILIKVCRRTPRKGKRIKREDVKLVKHLHPEIRK